MNIKAKFTMSKDFGQSKTVAIPLLPAFSHLAAHHTSLNMIISFCK